MPKTRTQHITDDWDTFTDLLKEQEAAAARAEAETAWDELAVIDAAWEELESTQDPDLRAQVIARIEQMTGYSYADLL